MATVVYRSPVLREERTWLDEDFVLLDGHGVAYQQPWPAAFRQADAYLAPSLGRVLTTLANHDAYPPALPLLVFALRGAANPITSLRLVLFGLGLCLLGIVYAVTRRLGSPWLALAASAYVASSTALTHGSQQIKWNSVAPAIAALTFLPLLRDGGAPRGRNAVYYVVATGVLLHVHYFGIWAVPAHLAFVAAFERRGLPRMLVLSGLVGASAAPWYLWGLPQQQDYLAQHWAMVAARSKDAYNAPLSLATWARGVGYDFLVVGGILPGESPARHRALFLILLFVAWAAAWRSRVTACRQIAFCGLVPLSVAIGGQSLYALRLGHVVPLQPHYLDPWIPLAMVASVAGAGELPRRWMRIVVLVGLLGGSVVTLALNPLAPGIAGSHGTSYAGLARAAADCGGSTWGLLHGSDRDAKLANLFFSTNVIQIVGWQNARLAPPEVEGLIAAGACGVGAHAVGPLWSWWPGLPCRGVRDLRLALRARRPPDDTAAARMAECLAARSD